MLRWALPWLQRRLGQCYCATHLVISIFIPVPVFSTGDIMERCSSSTTSANPQVKNASLQPHKHPLLFTDKDNFWLCPLSAGSFPLALWHSPGWMLMLKAGNRAVPQVWCLPAPLPSWHTQPQCSWPSVFAERQKQASCTLGFSFLSLFASSLESLFPFTFL